MSNDQRAYNLNRHLNSADPKKDWLVCFHGNTCGAILAGDYPGGMNEEGMFENTAYLRVIEQLLTTSEKEFPQLRLVHPSITADDLNIRIMWRTISDRRLKVFITAGESV